VRATVWLAVVTLALSTEPALANDEHQLTPAVRTAVVEAAASALAEEYVFPEVAAKMGALVRGKLAAGGYDEVGSLPALLRVLRTDFQSVSGDRHIALWEMHPDSKKRQEAEDREAMRTTNSGFRRLEVLPGNVGFLDVRIFDEPRRAGTTATAAMTLLANVDALVIDLRYNGGGEGNTVAYLLSHLYAGNPVHHLDNRFRDHVEQTWTEAWVPGPDLSGVPLWVLTSNGTFSAAEDFAYGLQTRRRATVVGERTRGGAHPVTFRFFAELNVEMMIPNAESVSPVTGGNWEGSGVTPDIEIAEIDAFPAAYVEALRTLLARASDEGTRQRLEWAMAIALAGVSPVDPGIDELRPLAGRYGEVEITLDGGRLYFVRDQRSRYRLIPLAPDLFRVETDFARFRFARDEVGMPSLLERLYPDGATRTDRRAAP